MTILPSLCVLLPSPFLCHRHLRVLVHLLLAFTLFHSCHCSLSNTIPVAESLSEIDTFLSTNAYVLLIVYAPWCHWSQLFLKESERAMEKLAMHSPPVRVMRVDAMQSPAVGERYGVHNFPSVFFFTDKVMHDYSGGRQANEIVNWINRHLEKEHLIGSTAEFDTLAGHSDLSCLLLGGSDTSRKAFATVARHYDHVLFFTAKSSLDASASFDPFHDHLKAKYASESSTLPPSPPYIVMLTPFSEFGEPSLTVYHGDVDSVEGIDKFVNQHRFPAIIPFTPLFANKIFNDGRPFAVYYTSIKSSMVSPILPESSSSSSSGFKGGKKKANEVVVVTDQESPSQMSVKHQETINKSYDAFRMAASEHRGQLLFVVSDSTQPHEKRLMEMIGLEEEDLKDGRSPLTIVTVNPAGHGHYRPALKYRLQPPSSDEPLSTSSIRDFITGFQAGTVQPHLKSEAIPETQSGPITVLVGKSFHSFVNNPSVDVFCVFFAPWCGHCRKLDPIFKELAEKLRHLPSLRFAKIDATRNEIEGAHIGAYPTLYLYPAALPSSPSEKQHHVEFRGERTVEKMIKFLIENVTHKFDANEANHGKRDDDDIVLEQDL